MAGHSKFANIKHRKGRQDAMRAKIFTKIAREITTAAKLGSPDPAMNPRLRLAIQNGRAVSMPKDRIERAIQQASSGGGEDYKAVRYEGFGPGGVGLIVETLTDNLNRTGGNLRSYFSKMGGNLGTTNSVTSGFDRIGEIRFELSVASEDDMMEAALEAGADDVGVDEENHIISCAYENLSEVSNALVEKFGDAQSANIIWKPHIEIEVEGQAAASLMKLLDTLEEDDDVQDVFGNYQIDPALLEG